MKPMTPRQARSMALAAALGSIIAAAAPASAEVRFGRNVYIGGHDFSHQTYNRNRRAIIHLYDRTPRNQGCTWRTDGRGGKVKVCHLRRR